MKRLSDAIAAVLKEPDVKAKFLQLGSVPSAAGPEEMAEIIRQEQKRWGAIVAKNKIAVE